MADQNKEVTGPQATAATVATIKSGEKSTQEGDYSCEGCGEKTRIQKELEVPNCPKCGKTVYRKEA